MLHVSIAAEKLTHLGGFPITNSLLYSFIVTIILVNLAILVNLRISFIPNRLQSAFESMIGTLYDQMSGILGKYSNEFFPLVMTFFIFILFANWLGLIPGLAGIGIKEEIEGGHEVIVPFLRGATADLNTTFALALISVSATVFYGITKLGLTHYLSKFFNFHSPIEFFIGILELVLEFAKIISFAFRLFGNIFAGEVLLAVMGMLVPILVPLPFLALETFMGLIQALIFSILTAVFLRLAVEEAH